MLSEGAPAHRKDVPGVILAPVIKGTPPPIEHDEHFFALHFSDGGRTDEVWVLLVHSLQLHAWFKVVLGGRQRFLKTSAISSLRQLLNTHTLPVRWRHIVFIRRLSKPFKVMHTFLKAVAGAISAPFKVLNRNMGHEEAFIRNPGGENVIAFKSVVSSFKTQYK